MSRNFLIVNNPYSGRKRSAKILAIVRGELDRLGIDYKVLTTKEEGNVDWIRSELNNEYSDVMVLGGDGTLNHVVNALQNKDSIISIISSGTGNDFIKNVSIGKNLKAQLDTAINGRVVDVDAGLCNDQVFINGVGIGFDGQIVHDMLHKKSILSGHAKYYAQVLRILATYKPKNVEFNLDGNLKSDKTILLLIGNGTTFGGGFKLTPDATVHDGLLDVCHIGNVSPIRRFMNIHRLNKGTHEVLNEINIYRGTEIEILPNENVVAHIDGEYLGPPPFKIKALPKYFKMRVAD